MEINAVEQTVDELTYRSYAFNRRQFPKVSPERWRTIFPDQQTLEERFCREENWARLHQGVMQAIFH